MTFFGPRGSRPVNGPDFGEFGGDTAMVVIDGGLEPILLDLGTGLAGYSRRLAQGGELRASCLLSHYHFDHIQGLPFFPEIDCSGNSLTIFAPDVGADPLDALFAPPYFPVSPFEFRGRVKVCSIPEGHFELAGSEAQVTALAVPHTDTAYGYRIEIGGVAVCYIPDHQAPPSRDYFADNAIELAYEADLVIHDAQYTLAEFEGKRQWGHSTHFYAVDLALAARAKRVALFHHDPSHSDSQLLAMEAEVRDAFSERDIAIFAARQGQSLQL